MKHLSFTFLIVFIVMSLVGYSQTVAKKALPKNTCVEHKFSQSAFASGEQLTYAMSYSVLFMWTDVGEVLFTANDVDFNRKPALHIRAEGKTYPFYDKFFKVRDVYESWVEPVTLRPIYFNREVDEGGYTIKNIYTFDWQSNRLIAYVKRKNHPEKTDTLQILPCSIDIVSILYYSRNIDYSEAKINQRFPVSLALDDELYTVMYRYMGKEEIDVKNLGRYRCMKFAVSLVKGTVFSGKEELTVWITDDANKIPIYIESPVKVGTVKGRIIRMKNLRFPLSSKIPKKD
jgi:Protein of unknown function (DUF3108).